MTTSTTKPVGTNETTTLTATKKPPGNFGYDFVPATEKFFGCCSQRAGCIIIGVAQIFLGSVAAGLQVVLAVMARGGIDLTKIFGSFPKEDSIKKFIFGVSVVDVFSKVVFVVSGIVIICGAIKRNASLLNAWMCINSYTFASSIATNAAAAGGLISFAESREEYAVPLTFDTLLMGAQFYVMSIVKGYHKHLEKAEEDLKKVKEDKKGTEDDHDIVHSSTTFRCWKCCMYEEKLQKQRTNIDHLTAWKEAEKERRSSIKGHATEAEQKKLMNRAMDAERKYQRLLLQQALREEQNRRLQNNGQRPGPSRQPIPWPPPPPGYQGNPNVRPGQPTAPPWWTPGWTIPPPHPNRRPQGQPAQPQPPRRPIPAQPPAGPAQPQPRPPQDGKKRPTEQNVRPSKGQGQGQNLSPNPSKSGTLTEPTLPSQDRKSKTSSKNKPSTATYTIEPSEEADWQSLSEEPIQPRQQGTYTLSEHTGKPQYSSRKRRNSK